MILSKLCEHRVKVFLLLSADIWSATVGVKSIKHREGGLAYDSSSDLCQREGDHQITSIRPAPGLTKLLRHLAVLARSELECLFPFSLLSRA